MNQKLRTIAKAMKLLQRKDLSKENRVALETLIEEFYYQEYSKTIIKIPLSNWRYL